MTFPEAVVVFGCLYLLEDSVVADDMPTQALQDHMAGWVVDQIRMATARIFVMNNTGGTWFGASVWSERLTVGHVVRHYRVKTAAFYRRMM